MSALTSTSFIIDTFLASLLIILLTSIVFNHPVDSRYSSCLTESNMPNSGQEDVDAARALLSLSHRHRTIEEGTAALNLSDVQGPAVSDLGDNPLLDSGNDGMGSDFTTVQAPAFSVISRDAAHTRGLSDPTSADTAQPGVKRSATEVQRVSPPKTPANTRSVRLRVSRSAPRSSTQMRISFDTAIETLTPSRVQRFDMLNRDVEVQKVPQTDNMTATSPAQSQKVSEVPSPSSIDNRRLLKMTNEQRLQEFLIRQQRIAGIPPEKMIFIRDQQQDGQGRELAKPPPIVQITNQGVFTPEIPPARFTGVFHPLPMDIDTSTSVRQPETHEKESQMNDVAQHETAIGKETNVPQIVQSNAAGDNSYVAGTQQAPQQDTGDSYVRDKMSKVTSPIQYLTRKSQDGLNANLTDLVKKHNQNASGHSRMMTKQHVGQLQSQDLSQRPAATMTTSAGRVENRTENRMRPFNILHAFVLHYPDVVFEIVRHLGLGDILNLYETSKYFNQFVIVNRRSFMSNLAKARAPESASIFNYRCYRIFTIPNPEHPNRSGVEPNFRWVAMTCNRENVVQDITRLMEEYGVPLPDRCGLVIKKLWMLMDICDNGRRIWTIRNKKLWPDTDLFFATLFFFRLQIILENRPVRVGRKGIRRTILAQPDFTLLRDTLKGTALQTPLEVVRAYIKWRYNPLPDQIGKPIFGVDPKDVGALQFEGYTRVDNGAQRLQTPDELVLRESIRRKLNMGRLYIEILSRYDDPPTRREPSWVEEVQREFGDGWEDDVVLD